MVKALSAMVLVPAASSLSLLPIFFMHGVDDNHKEFAGMQQWIRELDPDVFLYSLPVCDDTASYANLWEQGQEVIDRIKEQIAASPQTFADGYALVAHSQGALTARTAIERWDGHNVRTFVSLAGPQAGQYGIPEVPDNKLMQELAGVGKDLVFTIAFQGIKAKAFQQWLSFANYWNDARATVGLSHPHRSYLKGNTFLPVLNNDPGRQSQGPGKAKDDDEAQRYKSNFMRLHNVVFTAGTADDMVMPYQSAVFGFHDEKLENIIPLNESAIWADDWLGLRALSEAGNLTLKTVEGVGHNDWVHSKNVFQQHIMQHLPSRPGADVVV